MGVIDCGDSDTGRCMCRCWMLWLLKKIHMLCGLWFKRAVNGEDQWRGIDIQKSHDVLVRCASHARSEYVDGIW